MQTHSFYPLLQVSDVEKTALFYEQHLGFTRIFNSVPASTQRHVHIQNKKIKQILF